MPELGYIVGFVALIVTINLIGYFGYNELELSQSFDAPPILNFTDYDAPDFTEPEEGDALDMLVDILIELAYIIYYVVLVVVEGVVFVSAFAIYLLSFQSLQVFGLPLIWRLSLAAVLNTGLIISIIKLLRG